MLLPLILLIASAHVLSIHMPDDDVIVVKNNTAKAMPRPTAKQQNKQAAKRPTTTRYYYHWSHQQGTPHPEDLILALDWESNGKLSYVSFYCTSDEYDIGRKGYLPGFWIQEAYISDDDKIADNIYNLDFYTSGDMIYDHPVDARYKKNEDVWKSGKYNIWRYTMKQRPRLMTYSLRIDDNGTIILSGNGHSPRKFSSMDEARVISLNRNKYDDRQLASNRKVNPIDDPRQAPRLQKQTIHYPDSSYYTGEAEPTNDKRFIPHGQGRKVWKSGRTYEGTWQHGSPHGKGTMTWPSGGRYEGDWSKGKRNGHGIMTWSNGDRYEGQFLDGEQSGQGIAYMTDNDCTYEGHFENDKRNGYGVMRWGEKSKWAGCHYEGQWEEGWRTGHGTYYHADGRIERGRWDRNTLIEPEELSPEELPMQYVSIQASFPGGQAAMTQWLSQHINYPKQLKQEGPYGRVIVAFDVDSVGRIDNVNILHSLHEALDQEAIRVVKEMPLWNPARDDNNHPVKSRTLLPIFFGTPEKASGHTATEQNKQTSKQLNDLLETTLSMSKNVKVDTKKLEKWVHQKPEEYTALLQRFRTEPESLSIEEVANLYHAFPFTAGYDQMHVDLLVAPKMLMAQGQYQQAYDLCQQELQKAPMSYSLHMMAYLASEYLETKDEHSLHSIQATRLAQAIICSGTGFNAKSPLLVNYVADEYALFQLTFNYKMVAQEYDENRHCDIITLDRGNKGETIKLYFRTPTMLK